MYPKVSHKARREREMTWDSSLQVLCENPCAPQCGDDDSFSDRRKWQLGLWPSLRVCMPDSVSKEVRYGALKCKTF